MSRRTFFRYFPSKEAAFFARSDDRFDDFRDALRGARGASHPWRAVCDAVLAAALSVESERDDSLAWRAVLESTPQLQAYDLQIDALWEAEIREELCVGGLDPLEAAVRSASLVGACRAVLRAWYGSGGHTDLAMLVRKALAWLESGFRNSADAVKLSA